MTISNRAAYHHYNVELTYTAGISLMGTEIKSLRHGKVSFNDAYCYIAKGELFIKNLHITEYELGTHNNHNPTRHRKLLLHKKEILKIHNKIKEKGYTIIPLKIFINTHGWAKMEIALAKGKKLYDKREDIKKRELQRNMKRQYNSYQS